MEDEARRKMQNRLRKDDLEPALPKFIAEHKVAAGETLSDLSLKYYGSATKEKWMMIYAANKAVIGDNPNRIRTGQVLKIPALPKE
jgi:nucleoid-associated protein YgaU